MSDREITPPSAQWDVMVDYLLGNLSGDQEFSKTYTEYFLLPTCVFIGQRTVPAKKKVDDPC